MKKIILPILIFSLFLSCSKDDNSSSSESRMKDSAITNIFATGKVSEQSASEAKKTIFGKWNVGSEKNNSTSRSTTECIFNYIEFTDSSYIMSLSISTDDSGDPESGSIFGNYNLVEVDGLVTEVELFFSVSGSDIKIASLTNIEVIETATELDATFDIDFIVDFEEIDIVCNDLSGSYSADKEPAMDETTGASADTNHYKVVRNWEITSFSDSNGNDLTYFLEDYCLEDSYNSVTGESDSVLNPDCTVPSKFQVNLSTFGTYVTITLDSSDSPLEIETGTWDWLNDEQTEFIVDGGQFTGTISSLSETSWVFDAVFIDGTNQSFSFVAIP